jgi:regulator of replication initiation timing
MGIRSQALRKLWEGILGRLTNKRATSVSHLWEQLWTKLEQSTDASGQMAYPMDAYVGDDGSSLFAIVTQGGKLFQVPISVRNEDITLGEWTQVTEVFQPVQQSSFTIRRQADGRHRWMGVVATSVINRVGEIDSVALFDSFVEHWQNTGEQPRVDYYHMGDSDPEAWEFGTADYLAREDCCYIASGLFDEDHPLTQATIRAYERDPAGTWGWSIEFYAHVEPEIVVLNPKVQVPVYKRGKNTRISVVKEVDAAGLFTRIGITEEKFRMKRNIQEKLEELFGDDAEGLAAFVETVDTVNRTISDDKLIHRQKADEAADPDEDEDEDEGTDEEEDAEENQRVAQIELDEAGLAALAEQVSTSPAFVELQRTIASLTESVGKLVTAKEEDAKEIARMRGENTKLAKRLATVEADETEKKQTWAEDLPRRKSVRASYRPKDEHAVDVEEGVDEDRGFDEIAAETLRKLPSY